MAAMPDVAEVTRALFGDLIDPDVLVAKMDPGPSDVHVNGGSNRAVLIPRKVSRGRKTSERVRFAAGNNSERVRFGKDNRIGRHILEGVGIGATAVGGVLGARELKTSIPAARGLWKTKAGWLTAAKPGASLARVPRPGPAARTAGVVGMLGGDAIATGEQLHSARKPRQQSMAKAMPPINDLVGGILRNSRRANDAYMPAHAAGAARHAGVRQPLVGYGPKHAASDAPKRGAAKPAPKPAVKPTQRPGDKGMAVGTAVRDDVKRFAATGSGKVVIGAGGIMAARAVLGSRGGAVPAYDPYVGKSADVTITGTFSKFDDDRRLAFGWANVSKINGLPVVDRQGDYVSIEDIEDAAYTYVENSRVGGHMHRRVGGKAAGTLDVPYQAGTMVESMVFDDAKCEALGLPEDFPRGWWFGMRVSDDEVWDLAKRGELTGFSVHGKGIRKAIDYDEIMAH